MKIPALWTKPRSLCFSVTPAWCLAWGNLALSSENYSWQDDQIAISHIQPAFSLKQQFVVVGDIWLSNRAELLQHLDLGKYQYTPTDSELVAAVWELWGVESLKLLQGMFAFCIWDRQKQQLWLGRDRTGSRTLYYTTSGSTRWIAPRLGTLTPYHSHELDLVALRDYLCCAFVPGGTLWQQVRELRPGTSLSLPDETVQVYWQPQEQITDADQPLESHGKKVRSLLNQVVQEYLPVDEPVGAYLSGGLDSSCITALAAKFHNSAVHTYSIHFGSNCPNELEFSDLVAQHYHTQHHILEITPAQMWEQLPITMAQLDQPIGDPLTVPNYLVGQLARQSVKVILNGEGGDPCFGGPKNQPMLLNQLYNSVASTEADLLSAYLASFQKCSFDLPKLFKPNVWAQVQSEPSVFAADLHSSALYLNRLMALNIKFKGADHILTKVNNLTRAAGLEGRSPLFDQRIVEMSMQIPPEYKLVGAQEKAVLKQAVKDLLPEVILHRPKSGMMVPVQLWFRTIWQRKARALLLNKHAAIAPYLNQSLIREWLDYREDAWSRYGAKLWLLVSLEIWLQVNRGN